MGKLGIEKKKQKKYHQKGRRNFKRQSHKEPGEANVRVSTGPLWTVMTRADILSPIYNATANTICH